MSEINPYPFPFSNYAFDGLRLPTALVYKQELPQGWLSGAATYPESIPFPTSDGRLQPNKIQLFGYYSGILESHRIYDAAKPRGGGSGLFALQPISIDTEWKVHSSPDVSEKKSITVSSSNPNALLLVNGRVVKPNAQGVFFSVESFTQDGQQTIIVPQFSENGTRLPKWSSVDLANYNSYFYFNIGMSASALYSISEPLLITTGSIDPSTQRTFSLLNHGLGAYLLWETPVYLSLSAFAPVLAMEMLTPADWRNSPEEETVFRIIQLGSGAVGSGKIAAKVLPSIQSTVPAMQLSISQATELALGSKTIRNVGAGFVTLHAISSFHDEMGYYEQVLHHKNELAKFQKEEVESMDPNNRARFDKLEKALSYLLISDQPTAHKYKQAMQIISHPDYRSLVALAPNYLLTRYIGGEYLKNFAEIPETFNDIGASSFVMDSLEWVSNHAIAWGAEETYLSEADRRTLNRKNLLDDLRALQASIVAIYNQEKQKVHVESQRCLANLI